ncbi:MAG: hypothetical protein AAF098_15090 [Pseudomonadota bacterium]
MPVIPSHVQITNKLDWIDTHKDRGRISVPSKNHPVLEIIVFHWYDCSAIDGLPLDALIEGAPTRNEEAKRFGILWSDVKPDDYPIPVLWVSSGGGVWV